MKLRSCADYNSVCPSPWLSVGLRSGTGDIKPAETSLCKLFGSRFSQSPLSGLQSGMECRSGNPLLSLDLGRVSAERARTIVVLASGGGPAQSDARVLRTTLSLMGLHDLRTREGQGGLQVTLLAPESMPQL